MKQSAKTRAAALVAESQENRNPVWASYTEGLLVELAKKTAGWESAGDVHKFEGLDWTVCVVS